jgi:hypothetical protein
VTARVVLRDALLVALTAITAGLLAVAVVGVLGATGEVRDWYGLTPESPVAIPAWELWAHNVRVSLPVVGAALGVAWFPALVWVWDALVVLLISGNVLLVAVAFGVYGGPLLRLAGPHASLELLAMSAWAAAYLDARRSRMVRPWVLAGCVGAAVVLLAGAALLEGTV